MRSLIAVRTRRRLETAVAAVG
jgi:hypothetical protein